LFLKKLKKALQEIEVLFLFTILVLAKCNE